MKLFPRNQMRPDPIDIFYCRKCFVPVRTSSIDLFNKEFCQECFDAKIDTDGKKVISWGGNKYRVFRHQRKVVCSACNSEYDLLPSNYIPKSVEDQRARYEQFLIERQKWNGLVDNFNPNPPPFIPVNYDENVSPLGWTNELLCKKCLINYYESNYDEIQQENFEYDSQKEIKRKKEIREREISAAEDRGLVIGMAIFLIITLIVVLDKCSFGNSDNQAPADVYYNRR